MAYKLPDILSARAQALLDETYQAGFRDGSAYTRDAIMRAASLPDGLAASPPAQAADMPRPSGDRAARGAARTAVQAILTKHPGFSVQQMEDVLPTVNPAVSPRTISGELYRQKDRLYEQRGSRWFLKTAIPAVGAGGATGAGTPASETGNKGDYDAAA